ncbi:MAG: FTR1 family protein [Actinomycetota bacterium]
MSAAFLITLREGFEIALIIGIILAVLRKSEHLSLFRYVWIALATALITSLLAGGLIFAVGFSLEGRAEEIFEGSAMFLAVIVLTYMIFWMKIHAPGLRKKLEERLGEALERRSAIALFSLAFVVVLREGIETVLFMFSVTRTATPSGSAIGGILGISAAVLLGYLIYAGATHLNLRTFFRITGILLILVAAGLLARGIHEFEEAKILPALVEHVWNIGFLISEKGVFGSFLKSLIGYTASPSLLQVMLYFAYLTSALSYFLTGQRAGQKRSQ